MTEQQRDDLPIQITELWQWLAVTLSHASAQIHPPYIPKVLDNAHVLVHDNHMLSVTFTNGNTVQINLFSVDVPPDMGAILPVFPR